MKESHFNQRHQNIMRALNTRFKMLTQRSRFECRYLLTLLILVHIYCSQLVLLAVNCSDFKSNQDAVLSDGFSDSSSLMMMNLSEGSNSFLPDYVIDDDDQMVFYPASSAAVSGDCELTASEQQKQQQQQPESTNGLRSTKVRREILWPSEIGASNSNNDYHVAIQRHKSQLVGQQNDDFASDSLQHFKRSRSSLSGLNQASDDQRNVHYFSHSSTATLDAQSSILDHQTSFAIKQVGSQQDNQVEPQFQPPIEAGQKIGPSFTREPPGFIHYLNSSDLVIGCSASGQPPPSIVSR